MRTSIPLTGLPNRRALMERLQREWARIQRHGGRLSCIMADIDHFKRVNDMYGHHIGDKMLQEVAQAIARQCREVDLPTRYGGEEFAVVVPDETAAGAARLAERCRHEIAKVCVVVRSEAVRVTASFGVADATDLSSPEALIKRADEVMYQAKDAGRNQVRSCGGGEAGLPTVLPTDRAPMDATTAAHPLSLGEKVRVRAVPGRAVFPVGVSTRALK